MWKITIKRCSKKMFLKKKVVPHSEHIWTHMNKTLFIWSKMHDTMGNASPQKHIQNDAILVSCHVIVHFLFSLSINGI